MPELENGFIPPEEQQDNNLPEQPKQKSEIDAAQYERYIGAKLLSKIGVENKYSHIAQKSIEVAKKNGQKLLGDNNAERRNYATLERIDELTAEFGTEGLRRALSLDARRLLVQPQNIPESFWRSQMQANRDEGYGALELTDYAKQETAEKLRQDQLKSLQPWINYLGSDNNPYPNWFRLFVWHGISKLGLYNKEKQRFDKRDKTSTSPFVSCNPEIVGKIFGLTKMTSFDDEQPNQELKKLLESGRFVELYSQVIKEIRQILPVPEKTEDIQGEWTEFMPAEYKQVRLLAEGTGWCIGQNEDTALGSLLHGDPHYHGERYDHAPEYGGSDNQARFILFRLADKSTARLSDQACASIRLNPDGHVAEISGLKDGQALNDSLVPIVEAKVKTLPNGERFLEAFADKKTLIAIDHKVQAGEDLTKEELEFVYEINRPIKTLDTYNDFDPRIREIKEKYPVAKVLDTGVNAKELVKHLDAKTICDNLNALVTAGAYESTDELVTKLKSYAIADNLDQLLAARASIDNIVANLDSSDIAYNLDQLLAAGANIDNIVANLNSSDIADNLDQLLSAGVNADNIVAKLESDDIADNLNKLLAAVAKIEMLTS